MSARTTFVLSMVAASFVSLTASTSWAGGACVTAADRAQDLRNAGKLRAARTELLVCTAPTCNAVVRADCEKWLRELDAEAPSLVVHAVDARGNPVRVEQATIDDVAVGEGTAHAVDPGSHVVRVTTRGGESAERKVVVSLGEKSRRIDVRFDAALEEDGTKARPPRPPRADEDAPMRAPADTVEAPKRSLVVPIVLASVGVVALGTFAGFEVAGHSGYADLESGCAKTRACTDADIDPVRGKFIGASVALGVSVVALAAAALVYFLDKPASTPAKTSGRSDLRIVYPRFTGALQ